MQVVHRNNSSTISIIVTDSDTTFEDACILAVSFRFGGSRPIIHTTKTQLANEIRYQWDFSWPDNSDRGYATDLFRSATEKVRNDYRLTDAGRKRLLHVHGTIWKGVQDWPEGDLP